MKDIGKLGFIALAWCVVLAPALYSTMYVSEEPLSRVGAMGTNFFTDVGVAGLLSVLAIGIFRVIAASRSISSQAKWILGIPGSILLVVLTGIYGLVAGAATVSILTTWIDHPNLRDPVR